MIVPITFTTLDSTRTGVGCACSRCEIGVVWLLSLIYLLPISLPLCLEDLTKPFNSKHPYKCIVLASLLMFSTHCKHTNLQATKEFCIGSFLKQTMTCFIEDCIVSGGWIFTSRPAWTVSTNVSLCTYAD